MQGLLSPAAFQQSAGSVPSANAASALTGFLPKEHGSWSLALEPLALGLLIAPSYGGTALVTAALAGFFARRPLKAAAQTDRAGRSRPARLTLTLFATLAITGLTETLLIGDLAALWPLVPAACFGGLFVYFDAQNDSRAAAAELAGCTAFAFLPAALATLAGWSGPAALALATLALARSLPTVLTIRSYLRLQKQQRPGIAAAVLTAALAAGGVALLAAQQLAPWAAAVLAALLFIRTAWLVSSFRPALAAKHLGMIEAALGAVYVGAIAVAYHLQ